MAEDTPGRPGPPGSQREIFDRYYGPVRRFFKSRGFSPEDADDLTQDTFSRVFKHMGELRSHAAVEAWILSIAANTRKNELRFRKAARRFGRNVSLDASLESAPDAAEKELVDNSPPVPSQLDAALSSEKLDATNSCLDELPPRMRTCLLMHVAEDRRYQEIADLLRLSIQSVKSHIHQARQRLQECLGRKLAGGPT
jgi:RNA polymerase sigma-70 factor (ECF subfamily)